MELPKGSVIVLTYSGASYVEECLATMLSQDYPSLELIVVDNGSTDGNPDLVAERFAQVRLLRNQRHLGFSGNNVGLRAAEGDLLVLLNQDTRALPGWLETLTRTFENPTIGVAGSKLLYPDGTIQHAGAVLYGPRGESKHIGRYAQDDEKPDQVADTELVTAAEMAVSRSAPERIGPLDEGSAPAHHEDADSYCQARSVGLLVGYQPRSVAIHHESTATDPSSHEHRSALHQGRLRFLLTHRPLEQLLSESGPAELAWVATLTRSEELMAARGAYLSTILALPGILAFRGNSLCKTGTLVGLPVDLRKATVAGPVAQTVSERRVLFRVKGTVSDKGKRARLIQALQGYRVLHEHYSASKAPAPGKLLVALPSSWNGVATMWYVRPVMQQQSVTNAQLALYLLALWPHFEGQSRDMAESIREVTALAHHLMHLESPRISSLSDLSGSKRLEDSNRCGSS